MPTVPGWALYWLRLVVLVPLMPAVAVKTAPLALVYTTPPPPPPPGPWGAVVGPVG